MVSGFVELLQIIHLELPPLNHIMVIDPPIVVSLITLSSLNQCKLGVASTQASHWKPYCLYTTEGLQVVCPNVQQVQLITQAGFGRQC